MWKELYAAASLEEALPTIAESIPVWAPMTFLLGGGLLYIGSFRMRLLLSKWRRHERARLIQKYQLESAANSPSPRRIDDSQPLERVDPTVVTEEDLDEYHLSLGLMRPRDDDMIALVNKMILSDAIPEGWILFRCASGFLRFRELNTDELRFFHPQAKTTESVVRSTVSARNQADMEFQFGNLSRGASTSNSGGNDGINEPEVDFAAAAAESKKDEETFGRLLQMFMKRETAKIEAEVEESFRPTRVKGGSQSRRGGGALTPSLRVTLTVPRLDFKKVVANHNSHDAHDDEIASHFGNPPPVLDRTSSTSLPPMPKRPPTPRSSGVFEKAAPGTPNHPRVPSFRGPRSGTSTPTTNRTSVPGTSMPRTDSQ
ncbi:transmembrane protein, putative [Bodo saltans]|uniref:Transmembrane protein, putative n=1 Tax=Bodo saltans TaxID=75058 RepID=A0A0S4IXL3_BODSA|nr:transmembrane protein, putative [Bodo saltans]|eukprot:CUF94800.1 transmembrane protein, putative [Bodo saltans]